jgi:hypothetical protein
MAALNGYKITADGTYTIACKPGRYALGIGGADFGSGSLAVNWIDPGGNAIAYPDSPLTAVGGLELVVPGESISLVLSSATDPVIHVSLTRID